MVYPKRQCVYMIKSEFPNIKYLCAELQSCLQGKGPTPSYEIELCFGEEFPDPNVPKTRKLIMARVGEKGATFFLRQFLLHIYPEFSFCFYICPLNQLDQGFDPPCKFPLNAKHHELGFTKFYVIFVTC